MIPSVQPDQVISVERKTLLMEIGLKVVLYLQRQSRPLSSVPFYLCLMIRWCVHKHAWRPGKWWAAWNQDVQEADEINLMLFSYDKITSYNRYFQFKPSRWCKMKNSFLGLHLEQPANYQEKHWLGKGENCLINRVLRVNDRFICFWGALCCQAPSLKSLVHAEHERNASEELDPAAASTSRP